MIEVPTISTLKLLAESDQQLFVYTLKNIGLNCIEYSADPLIKDVHDALVESLATEMCDLDEYRSAAKSVAEAHGYKVGINEDLTKEPLIINEIFGAIGRGLRSAYDATMNYLNSPEFKDFLSTIGEWFKAAAEYAAPLLASAIENNRRYYDERTAVALGGIGLAEYLYLVLEDLPNYDPGRRLSTVIGKYINSKYAEAGKGQSLSNLSKSSMSNYDAWSSKIQGMVNDGVNKAADKGRTDEIQHELSVLARKEYPDMFISGGLLALMRKQRGSDPDGSFTSLLQSHYDPLFQSFMKARAKIFASKKGSKRKAARKPTA